MHLGDVIEIVQKRFPEWKSETQFENRVLWLLSLGCISQTRARTYQITPFGKRLLAEYNQTVEETMQSVPNMDSSFVQEALILVAELETAAFDSQSPHRFEQAVADAFVFLGYEVERLGAPGKPDVIARAYIGPESYTVILDSKARRSGKLNAMELYALQEHMEQCQADYATIVAQGFANGRLSRQAEEYGVLLLSIDLLKEWLISHAVIPLNLHEYRAVFVQSGLLLDMPAEITEAVRQRRRWSELLVDLVDLIQDTYIHGLRQPLPAEQLFSMLVTRLRDVRYSLEEVQQAVELLTHPALCGTIGSEDKGIALAMNGTEIAHSFNSFAQLLDSSHRD